MSRHQDDSSWPDRGSRRSERRFGFRGVMVIGCVAILLLLWFAPTVIVRSPLRDPLLQRTLSDFPGRTVIGSMSAGWLSPISIDHASITDAQGNEVAKLEHVRTAKNLLSLILDMTDIGLIRIEQPHLNLVLRDDGSNVEDLLRPWLEKSKSSSTIGYAIEVVGGSVSGTYSGNLAGQSAPWSISKIDATVTMPKATGSQSAKVKAELAVANQPPGQLNLQAEWPSPAASNSAGETTAIPFQGTFALQSTSLPLEVLNPWLGLVGLDIRVGGVLSSDVDANLSPDSQSAVIKQLSAANLVIVSRQYLGADRLQLASFNGKGEVSRSAGRWQVRGLNLVSDFGKIELTGSGPAGKEGISGQDFLNAIRRGSGELHSTIDLVKVAASLPHTLRLRDATHVGSGQLQIELTSVAETDGRQWNISARGDNFAAVHEGRQIVWRQPLVMQVKARESAGVVSVSQLTCLSSFLQLSGQGTLAQGQLNATGDLTQFIQEMGQLIDLGDLRAVGKVDGRMQWNQTANQMISLTGDANAENLEVASANLQPWQEKKLHVEFRALGKADGHSVTALEQGTLEVTAAGDHLVAELREGVALSKPDTRWPIHCKLEGNLGQWLRRVQMFVALPGWQIEGDNLAFDATVIASKQAIEISGGKGSIKNLKAYGKNVFIDDPTLQFETSARYDIARGELTATKTTISGTAVALGADQVRYWKKDGSFALDGKIQYRTNLERLCSWFHDPRQAATYRLAGSAVGTLLLNHETDRTNADLSADIESFSYAQPAQPSAGRTGQASWTPWWEEPRLKLALQGSYEAVRDRVQLSKIEAAGESLSVGAAGEIQQPFTRCDVQLTGQYAYDLERLTKRMQGLLGPQVKMTGAAARPFTLRGPLASLASSIGLSKEQTASLGNAAATMQPVSAGKTAGSTARDLRALEAEASLGWKTLTIQGFEIGEGEIETKLANGILTVAPLELPVSEGTVRIAPQVDLNRTPGMVTVQPGTIVDHVRITPEACRSWLKYVAPLVADATAAEGKFSVQLSQAACPLTDPTGGDVQGTLLVHSAQIGPGPLAQELITLAQQIKALMDRRPAEAVSQVSNQWLAMPEQQLNFQLADHRVYHRDLQMAINEIVIRTQGWVGLDQQLALVAEVPVRDEWVANDRYLSSLKGQTIKLPINGSLTRPQVDRRALTELGRQTVREAGTNFLQEQLNRGLERGLDRFFQPKSQSPAPTPTPPQ